MASGSQPSTQSTQKDRFDETGRPKIESRALRERGDDVVSFMHLALHTDGEFTIKTSPDLDHCVHNTNTQRLQQQVRRAYSAHVFGKNRPVVTRRRNARAPSAVKVERSPIVSPHRRIESKDHEPVLKRKHSNTRSPSPLAAAGATLVPAAPFNEPHDTQLLTIAVPTKTRTFAISDEEKLLEFYEHCFTGMQGMASKRIAREWIKGISPKKQAIYPYQSSKHKKPQWWPPTDVCPFTEPDHLKKDERLQLVLHLLRLRPRPEELKVWNDGVSEPHITHITRGWTEFLRELAPPNILRDPRGFDERKEQQARFLQKLYEAAHWEEQYRDGGIDDTFQVQWPEDLIVPIARRKHKKPAPTPVAPNAEGTTTQEMTSAIEEPRSKRRQTATASRGQDDDLSKATSPRGRKRAAQAVADQKQASTGDEAQSGKGKQRVTEVREDKEDPKSVSALPPRDQSLSHAHEVAKVSSEDSDTEVVEDTGLYQTTSIRYLPLDSEVSRSMQAQDTANAGADTNRALVWPQAGLLMPPAPQNESFNSSFSSSASSFYPASAAASFVMEEPRSMPSGSLTIQDPMHGLHFDDGAQNMLAVAVSQHRYFDTEPNSPALPSAELIDLKPEFNQPYGTDTRNPVQPHYDNVQPYFRYHPSSMHAFTTAQPTFDEPNFHQRYYHPAIITHESTHIMPSFHTLPTHVDSTGNHPDNNNQI